MLKKVMLFAVLMGFSHVGFSQQLEIKSNLWGTKIYQDGKLVGIKELSEITSSHKIANDFALKAKTNKGFSDVFGGVGGFLVGWSIGTKIGGGEFNNSLFYTGLGVIAVGIPFSIGMTKNAKKSVEAYNGNTGVSSVQYSFIANSNGLGLSLNF
ncbi:MAG: hypothetical protein ACPG6V_09625 [Flavobacteriales bacterium]